MEAVQLFNGGCSLRLGSPGLPMIVSTSDYAGDYDV